MSNEVVDEEEYEVENIVGQKVDGDNREQFLVKWKNWSIEHNSWVWREDLNCPELLAKFYQKTKAKPSSSKSSAGSNKVKTLKSKPLVKRRRTVPTIVDETSTENDDDTESSSVSLQITDHEFSKHLNKFLTQFGGSWRSYQVKRGKFEIDFVGNCPGQILASSRKKVEHFEQKIAKLCAEQKLKPILVENNVDNAVPPQHFKFILSCLWSNEVTVDKDAVIGCTCQPYCSAKTHCCPEGMNSEFAYRTKNKLRIVPGKPIFECNERCQCDKSCANRTVQRGRQFKLCIFRTENGRGWGVKTLETIKKDSFVMEYVGEVITNEEGDRRYEESGAEYLFDLDFFESNPDYVIDATHCGNESHFVNHSCDPNMAVFSVFIDHLEVRLPRIALFATRDIAKGEELTFDYAMTTVESQTENSDEEDDEDSIGISASSFLSTSRSSDNLVVQKIKSYAQKEGRKRTNGQVKCLCGAKNCRGFVFLDKKRDDDAKL